ncbi:MAG: putative transposase, partial [Pseudonocardiales bacterium]|nr:putative transposase [Pseudonocardiales bacterium]
GTRLDSMRFLLRDRDDKYSPTFDAIFQAETMDVPKSAPRAPRMNAHCERIIRTLRSELCDHILILNASHAREILTRYQRHYNEHRPHQSRDQLTPETDQQPATVHDLDARRLLRTRIRGGLINEYLSLTCSDDFSSGTGWLKQRSIVGRGCFDYLATVAACRPASETDEAAGAYGFTCSATVGRLAPRADCWSRAVREFSRPHRLGIQAFKCASHRRRRAAERSGPGNHEP